MQSRRIVRDVRSTRARPKDCWCVRGDRVVGNGRLDVGACQLRPGHHCRGVLVHLARTSYLDLISRRPNGRIGVARTLALPPVHLRRRLPPPAGFGALLVSLSAIGLLTAVYFAWLRVTNPTIVALSFLLIVLIVAAVSRRWVAITTSLMAFLSFNYFFLPPVGTWMIADPENWVALFTLLAVSIVGSHLSAQVRRRAQEATARRDELARLFDLTRDILLTTDTADAVALVARYIARRFGLKGCHDLLAKSAWMAASSLQRANLRGRHRPTGCGFGWRAGAARIRRT